MKTYRCPLLASFLLIGTALAAEPPRTDSARPRLEAEQAQKQALADALWPYLKAKPKRMRLLDAAVERLYGLALKESESSDVPGSASVGVPQWQQALPPLRSLGLSPATAAGLKALEESLGEAARLLAAIPAVPAANASPMLRMERQQALLAAATSLLALKQKATFFDAQLDEEARRSASGAHLLAAQAFLLPAAPKGEKR